MREHCRRPFQVILALMMAFGVLMVLAGVMAVAQNKQTAITSSGQTSVAVSQAQLLRAEKEKTRLLIELRDRLLNDPVQPPQDYAQEGVPGATCFGLVGAAFGYVVRGWRKK